jgi:Nucleotidyl transferase AbiEii toxin, Type IV TA system
VNRIAQLDAAARADIFAETADRVALPEALVEKDFWVCWTLAQIFTIEAFRENLLFKGGTSLSKVFGLIKRFSEDIDLAVDYAMLGFTGEKNPLAPGLSRTKQTSLLASMLEACREYIAGPFIDQLRQRFTDVLGPAGSWRLAVDRDDLNIVRFYYPAAVASRVAYIAPQVTLELGTHAEFVPRGEFSIRSFAADEFPNLFNQPGVRVTSLLAKRTFWEKATILHAEFYRPPEKPTPARYSRHYYDVAMMAAHPVKDEACRDLGLLAAVVKHKRTFYPSAWAQYSLAMPGALRLAPAADRIPELRRDYQAMSVMIFGEPPSFDRLVEALVALENVINRMGE